MIIVSIVKLGTPTAEQRRPAEQHTMSRVPSINEAIWLNGKLTKIVMVEHRLDGRPEDIQAVVVVL
jgi:hypothetical protein